MKTNPESTLPANFEVSSDKQRVHYLRGRRSCLRLVIVAFLIPALCYGTTWLFAKFGGEWATSADLPLPPDSQFLGASYADEYLYSYRYSVYAHQSLPEELRDWFVQAGIPMSPIPLNLEKTSFIEYDNYYGTPSPFHLSSPFQQLHSSAAMLTQGWWDEMMPDCQAIRIYKSPSLALDDFPQLDVSNATSVFVLTTCWSSSVIN